MQPSTLIVPQNLIKELPICLIRFEDKTGINDFLKVFTVEFLNNNW